MEDREASGGLNVLLRYMNTASPNTVLEERQDWVALRTVAELAYLSGTAQNARYPLMRTAASCYYLRSSDPVAGASHPLLLGLSLMDDVQRRGSPNEAGAHSLVHDFVRRVVSAASASLYPHLGALCEASMTPSATPQPSVNPVLALGLGETPRSNDEQNMMTIAHPTSTVPTDGDALLQQPSLPATDSPASDVARFPALASLLKAVHSRTQLVLDAVLREFVWGTVNPFDAQRSHQYLVDDSFFVAKERGPLRNHAFLFTKPHAFGRPVQQLVEHELKAHGLRIERCGVIGTQRIAKERLIDKHYASISRFAITWPVDRTSQALEIHAREEFERAFGESWDSCVVSGRVWNAAEAQEKLRLGSGAELAVLWNEVSTKKAKISPGLYVAYLVSADRYVLNGFYPANRDKYTAHAGYLNWYVVSWDPSLLSWRQFRSAVVGCTNPRDAPVGSIRRLIFDNWRDLGLSHEPNTADNGIHASAGPLEGLAERLIWVPSHYVSRDYFGRATVAAGVSPAFLAKLLGNPEVLADGRKSSAFDRLEDVDAQDAIDTMLYWEGIAKGQAEGSPSFTAMELLAKAVHGGHGGHLKYLGAVVVLPSTTTAAALQDPVAPPLPPATASAAVAPVAVMAPPVPPTVERPVKPTPPRAIASPYHYNHRNCGLGLETVMHFAMRLESVQAAAACISQTAAPARLVFHGLRALHQAAVEAKSAVATDPYLRLVTVTWDGSSKATVARPLPPLPPGPRNPAAQTQRMLPSTSQMVPVVPSGGATVGASGTARHRIGTAERIRRRTAKLQEEIAELNRRHEERMEVYHASSSLLHSPRKPQQRRLPGGHPRTNQVVDAAASSGRPRDKSPVTETTPTRNLALLKLESSALRKSSPVDAHRQH